MSHCHNFITRITSAAALTVSESSGARPEPLVQTLGPFQVVTMDDGHVGVLVVH